MKTSEYKNMYEHEEEHFYYVSLHNLVLNLIQKYRSGKFPLKILDAGCGTGKLAEKMKGLGLISGIDLSRWAVSFAKKRGVDVKIGSVTKLPFKDKTFDVVTCIDVIYHREIKNDLKALGEIHRVLKKGGFAVIRVPAFEILRSNHDIQVYTARRYTPDILQNKITKIGFKTLRLTPINFVLGLISLIKKFFDLKKAGSAIERIPSWVNNLLLIEINIENQLILRGLTFSFGQGLVCVVRK